MQGKVILIPTTLGDNDPYQVLPSEIKTVVTDLKYFIVENIRTTRRFLKKMNRDIVIDDLIFFELNKHTDRTQIAEYLEPVQQGHDIGIISEAGCPGVADPGADVVEIAHQLGLSVKPLVGPSSILMSLMASGMNGQNFAFVGYLPIKQPERGKYIKQLERRAQNEQQTQMFIETPYRNMKMLDELCRVLDGNTKLCIACDITLESEYIVTKKISEWKKQLPEINKRPAIFLLA